MDFVHDQLANGSKFRVLTVVDKWSRESVMLEVDFALTGMSVVWAFERLAMQRSLPEAITVDNWTEFKSKALDECAWRQGVQLDFISPGKPVENGMIESFNGRLCDVRPALPAEIRGGPFPRPGIAGLLSFTLRVNEARLAN